MAEPPKGALVFPEEQKEFYVHIVWNDGMWTYASWDVLKGAIEVDEEE